MNHFSPSPDAFVTKPVLQHTHTLPVGYTPANAASVIVFKSRERKLFDFCIEAKEKK
jgi:hypothetical protein